MQFYANIVSLQVYLLMKVNLLRILFWKQIIYGINIKSIQQQNMCENLLLFYNEWIKHIYKINRESTRIIRKTWNTGILIMPRNKIILIIFMVC